MPDWQAILDQDGPAVWQTAYRLLGNRADADECFQEAFLAALAVSRREPVRHWRALLQRLAASRAIDRLRQRRRRPGETLADWDAIRGTGPPPSQEAEDAELAEQLRAALAHLPPNQAEVFCLHCLDGWSYQDVARQLNVTVDSVGVLLHRARKQLRERLATALGVRPVGDQAPPSQKEPS
jgi:RNA polymerase sigma-70 factor (ECF subfamily)